MGLIKKVSILSLESIQGGMAQFYTPQSCNETMLVQIPAGVPHGAINLSSEPCFLVNAVLRHGPVNKRDYQPRPCPFPYNLEKVQQVLANLSLTMAV